MAEAHTSMLAFLSSFALALMALSSTAIWLMLWSRTRTGYMLPLAFGWGLLCAYWSLLAISAGPAPVLARVEIASIVREWGLVAAVVMEAGKIAMLWRLWRNGAAERN